jgi:broad-specificity NMP kinase
VKVVLVGEPGAGKTTLSKRLRSLEDESGLKGNFPKEMSNIATDRIEVTEIHNKVNVQISNNRSKVDNPIGGFNGSLAHSKGSLAW